jgi:hypothetical protein
VLLLPLVERLIDPDSSEFFEDVLEVLSYLTYYSPQISTDVLGLLPRLVAAFADWAIEFSNQMLVPLDNMVTRATDAFLAATDAQGTPYVTLLLSLPERVLGVGDGEPSAGRERLLPESECHGAVRLLQSLLHNCAGRIDAHLPAIVRTCLHGLRSAETVSMRTLLLDALASALHYDARLAIAALEAVGATASVLDGWTRHVADASDRLRAHDCKCMVLGFAGLLSAGPPASLPPAVQAGLVGCVRAASTLLARKRALAAEAARREAGEDDDDDDDDDGRDLNDDDSEDDFEVGEPGDGGDGDGDDGGGAKRGGAAGAAGATGLAALGARPLDVSKALRAGALTGDELSRLVSEFGDDDDLDDDDDEYASPLDAVDELAAFFAVLERACVAEPRLRALIASEMAADEQAQLQELAESAARGAVDGAGGPAAVAARAPDASDM